MKNILRWLLKSIFSLLLLVIVALSILIIFKIPVDITRFKEPVEVLVSKTLDRKIQVKESIVISTSLNPYLTIKGLEFENPEVFEADHFLSIDLAKIQLKLLPLLKMKVDVSEILLEGLDLILEETETGKVNWIFNSKQAAVELPSPPANPVQEPVKDEKTFSLSGDTLVVRKLQFRDINVNYFPPNQEKPTHFQIKSCTGSMLAGKPLRLDIEGKSSDFDYKIDVSVGSLEELLEGNKSWVKFNASIAETELSFSGDVNLATASKSLTLETTVQGGNLSSLNDLLRVDLPPFAAYKLETRLHLQPDKILLEKLVVHTGSSKLEGSGEIVEKENHTIINLQVSSPFVQIDDFVFDNWSWNGEEGTDEVVKKVDAQNEDGKAEKTTSTPNNKKLIDPELLAKYECSLEIEALKVLSGQDVLGSGNLHATLSEGRIRVDPLKVQLPAGKIEMMASVKPGPTKSDAELRTVIENFDIGVLVRRSRPESEMGGLVNLDMYVQSSASTIDDLLANGNGYFDFSGDLENFSAGIIDLWAVNLIATIVSNGAKDESELNCAVGRWSVIDGYLRPDTFFVDTSKIRICAEGEVDFKNQRVDMKVKPHPKKPEYFNLATPLELHGSFSDINIGIGGGGVVGSVVKFLASPVSVTLKRTFAKKIPADGSDVCNMVLGPNDRKEIIVPLCSD